MIVATIMVAIPVVIPAATVIVTNDQDFQKDGHPFQFHPTHHQHDMIEIMVEMIEWIEQTEWKEVIDMIETETVSIVIGTSMIEETEIEIKSGEENVIVNIGKETEMNSTDEKEKETGKKVDFNQNMDHISMQIAMITEMGDMVEMAEMVEKIETLGKCEIVVIAINTNHHVLVVEI